KRTPFGPGLEGCRIGSKTRAKTTVWSDYLDDPCNQGKIPKLPKGWTFSFKTLGAFAGRQPQERLRRMRVRQRLQLYAIEDRGGTSADRWGNRQTRQRRSSSKRRTPDKARAGPGAVVPSSGWRTNRVRRPPRLRACCSVRLGRRERKGYA